MRACRCAVLVVCAATAAAPAGSEKPNREWLARRPAAPEKPAQPFEVASIKVNKSGTVTGVTGRGGDILAYLMRLSLWGIDQIMQIIGQNGPLVLVGATGAALVWVVRKL